MMRVMSGEAGKYANIHGRRGGRGVRPYLIVLKVTCVAGFLGGLMTVLAVLWSGPHPTSGDEWRERAEFIGRAFRWVIVPGVTGAEIVGVLLASSIWRVMIRMRWFIGKMALVFVCMPSLHFFMSGRLADLRVFASVAPDPARAADVHGQLLVGTCFALVLGIVLVILGRIKPRLGQDYGRTFGSGKS